MPARSFIRSLFPIVIAVFAALVLGATSARAQTPPTAETTFTQVTATGGNYLWTTAANWDNGVPVAAPGSPDDALVSNGTTVYHDQTTSGEPVFGTLTLGTTSTFKLRASSNAGLPTGSNVYFSNGSILEYTAGSSNRDDHFYILPGAAATFTTAGTTFFRGTLVGAGDLNVILKGDFEIRKEVNLYTGDLTITNANTTARKVWLRSHGGGSKIRLGEGVNTIGNYLYVTEDSANQMADAGTLKLVGGPGTNQPKFNMPNSDTIANLVVESPGTLTGLRPLLVTGHSGNAAALTVTNTVTFQGTADTVEIKNPSQAYFNGVPRADALNLNTPHLVFQGTGDWTIVGTRDNPDFGYGTVAVTGGGDITTDTNATLSAPLKAPGGFTKKGAGTLVLEGICTSGGTTVVDAGRLQVDSSITSSSQVLVNPNGTLGGVGYVGPVTLAGGTVSPGGSIGVLHTGNTVWQNGSGFNLELDDATGGAGTGWDLLQIDGSLDLSALSAGGFTVDVDTLQPGGGTFPGLMDNFDPANDYSWEFARASGGISNFDAADFLVDVNGFLNVYAGTFEVTSDGTSLYLAFIKASGLPDSAVSTVEASPASLPADGVSTSTITVTLKTTDGDGVLGREVVLTNTGGPGVAVIIPAPPTPVVTDANGVATFTVSSTTVGTEVFTATDITDVDNIVVDMTASVAFSIVSQTSLIPGYTPPPPPPPDAPQTSLAGTTNPPPPESQATAQDTSEATEPREDAVPGIIRVTEYYLTTGDFGGTAATLTLDQDLAADYFILVRGSRDGNGLSMPETDYARVASVPGGRGGLPDSGASDAIGLRRAAAEFAWEGVVTVVECLEPDSPAGFRLVDAVGATLSGATGSLACAPWGDASRVVPFGGYRGGGVELTGGTANRYQGTSAYVRLVPGAGGTLDWVRDGGGETLSDAIMTTFVVEWGIGWTVQHAAVAGSDGGDGVDAPEEYTTAAIAPVARDNTWVWGTGIRTDAGIGDCAESCVVTLGDGVNLNATESAVAVGSEYTDAYSFDVYALTHPSLAVDHRFKPDGDLNGLDIPVSVNPALSGARFAWGYNGCNGTSSRFPRPRMWTRYTDDGTVAISRGYGGATFPAWIQGIDFSGLETE